VLRFLSALSLLAGTAVLVAPGASGDAPQKQGWWNRLRNLTPVFTIPAPPGAVAGGLTVGRDPKDGEWAVAAVYVEIEYVDADGSLYLGSADGKAFSLPPDAVVRACPALTEWVGGANETWTERPEFDRDRCVPGELVAAGTGMLWPLPGTLQKDGTFDIVLFPDGGQVPWYANFAAPNEGAFVVNDVPPPTTTTTTTSTTTTSTSTTTTTPVETIEETDPVVSYEVGGARSGGGAAAPVTTTTSPPRQPTTLVASDPPDVPFSIPDSRAERIFAVSLLFFMATALWWLSGSPARMPRLIGALAADARRPSRVPAPERGVGRFTRPREGVARPPRL
jgi:hypothetical protein